MSEHAETMAQRLEQALDRLNIKAVFGEPLREGETTLIPVAETTLGFGFGYGSGPGQKGEEEEEEGQEEEGAPPADQVEVEIQKEAWGGGAGGGGKARPMGYIQVDAQGVHFEPIMDITRMGLAGIAMVAWCVFWIAAAARAGRKRRS